MTPVIIGGATLYQGDCIETMRTLADASIDSVVTDPPYGIRFMGKAWDGVDIDKRAATRRAFASRAPDAGPNGGHKSIAAEAGKYDLAPAAMRAFQEFSEEWAREAFRVLKPGGHLLSFSSARTYHRMTSGIEDAGFEIRDQMLWLYGSGFPKSHNLDGAHTGWGTALKPAHEPVCVARKPLIGTVAANVLAHGTGAININACRIPGELPTPFGNPTQAEGWRLNQRETDWQPSTVGRWPANIIHDGSAEVVALFPEVVSGSRAAGVRKGIGYGSNAQGDGGPAIDGSAGSAARFFYCAKARRADRNDGTDALPQKKGGMVSNTSGQHITRRDEAYVAPLSGNHHPTVKPTDLMAYLVRLVTPPGGLVLDPFMGSGSTGKACMREGFRFVGIDLSAEYVEIARARIEHEIAAVAASAAAAREAADLAARQIDLFAEAP